MHGYDVEGGDRCGGGQRGMEGLRRPILLPSSPLPIQFPHPFLHLQCLLHLLLFHLLKSSPPPSALLFSRPLTTRRFGRCRNLATAEFCNNNSSVATVTKMTEADSGERKEEFKI